MKNKAEKADLDFSQTAIQELKESLSEKQDFIAQLNQNFQAEIQDLHQKLALKITKKADVGEVERLMAILGKKADLEYTTAQLQQAQSD